MTSTAPALDTRTHSAAVKSAINEQFGPWNAYSFGEAPGDPKNPDESQRALPLPDIYALVGVERRYLPALRRTGQAGRSGWRVSVRSVGRSVAEAQWAQDRVYRALDEVVLTFDEDNTTPLQHEGSSVPEWDDGRFSALSTFTYAV